MKKQKFVVRAVDDDFVEVAYFDTFNAALKYADKMGELFGSWNVEIYATNAQ